MKELSPKHSVAADPPKAPGAELRAFMEQPEPEGRLMLGTLSPAAKKALGSKTGDVLLDRNFVEHQRASHKEVPIEAHEIMREVLASPTLILQQPNRRLLLLKRAGQTYALAVKTTADRSENWVASFWIESLKSVRQQLKKFPVIFGNPDDLAD